MARLLRYLLGRETFVTSDDVCNSHDIEYDAICEFNHCKSHPTHGEHIVLYIDEETPLNMYGDNVILYSKDGGHSMWYKNKINRFINTTQLPFHVYVDNKFMGIFKREGDPLFVTDISNSRKKGWFRKFDPKIERGISIQQRWAFPIVKA